MRAIWYDRTGPAREVLQYGERPDPEPGQGQALVRIHASGVNPSDVGMRGGRRGPHGLSADHAQQRWRGRRGGRGTGRFPRWVGKRVWFYNGQRNGRAFGSAAELIELDTDLLSDLPDGVSFAEGADARHSLHDRAPQRFSGRAGAGPYRAGDRRRGGRWATMRSSSPSGPAPR